MPVFLILWCLLYTGARHLDEMKLANYQFLLRSKLYQQELLINESYFYRSIGIY